MEWPLLMDVTTDFVYCRLHGSEQLYASGYEADAISVWADRVTKWANGNTAKPAEEQFLKPKAIQMAHAVRKSLG